MNVLHCFVGLILNSLMQLEINGVVLVQGSGESGLDTGETLQNMTVSLILPHLMSHAPWFFRNESSATISKHLP